MLSNDLLYSSLLIIVLNEFALSVPVLPRWRKARLRVRTVIPTWAKRPPRGGSGGMLGADPGVTRPVAAIFTTISSKISSFFWIAFLDQKSTIFGPKMDHFWSPKTRFFKRKCWRKTWLFKTREVSKMTTLSSEITTFIKLAYWTSYVLCISFVKKMHKIWSQN